MKKRLLGALLALCMMFSLFPVSAFASADFTGGVGSTTLPAPQADLRKGNKQQDATVYEVSTADELATKVNSINSYTQSGNFKIILKEDITPTSPVVFTLRDAGSTVTITGPGKLIHDNSFSGTSWAAFLALQNGTLNLEDLQIVNRTPFGDQPYNMVSVSTNSPTLNLENCTIDGGGSDTPCRGIAVWAGSATLTDSTIQNCDYTPADQSSSGGGVYLYNNVSLSMSNSTITDCSAAVGGGVYVGPGGTLSMESGGKIYNNTATSAGNDIYLEYSSGSGSTAVLANAASMNAADREGRCIDVWYPDDTNKGRTRYNGDDGETYVAPISGTVTTSSETDGIGLVASHAAFEIPPDSGSSDGGAGAIVAGTLIGGTAYLLGTRIWLESTYGYLPANRTELALGLWKRAGCPAPASTELYADIDADDTDAQAAARWCVEQGLLKDYHEQSEDGTETVTFKPGRYVARPYALNRWYKLEKLLSEQQSAAQTAAEAPAETTET